jgi:hypothetical protein
LLPLPARGAVDDAARRWPETSHGASAMHTITR